jgi:C4-dicarboxylate-specific signal transduction histidine kinase
MTDGNVHRILTIDDNSSIHSDFRRILCASKPDYSGLAIAEMGLFGEEIGPALVNKQPQALFEMDSALQGQDGFEMVKKALANGKPYALAFVDVRMPPGWDGVRTMAEIRRIDKDIQLVICTAYSDYSWDRIVDKVERLESLLILKKPFDSIEITQMAHALTTKWQLQRELKKEMDSLEIKVKKRTQDLEQANSELQRRIEERERMLTERLMDRSLKTVGQLVTDIVSGLSSSVVSVGHHLDELKSQLSENQKSGAIPGIFNEVSQQLDGMYDILQATGEYSSETQWEKTRADLNKMLSDVLLLTRSKYEKTVQLECELGELPLVCCQASQINQVLVNLVSNIATFSTRDDLGDVEKKRILVKTCQDGDEVVISLQDQGKIPEEIRDIYALFFSSEDVGDLGQGLAISLCIARNHGGSLSFSCDESLHKATFSLRLPIDSSEHPT